MCLPLSSLTKNHKAVDFDHSYPAEPSSSEENKLKLKKGVQSLQEWLWHRKRKIKNMKDLIAILKLKANIADQQAKVLKYSFSGATLELFSNQMMNQDNGSKHAHWYSTEMKQFAMTLHYYSMKAYDFVCKMFSLPHPASIHTWAGSVDCEPRYHTNVIKSWGKLWKRQKYGRCCSCCGCHGHAQGNILRPQVQKLCGLCGLWTCSSRAKWHTGNRSPGLPSCWNSRRLETSNHICFPRSLLSHFPNTTDQRLHFPSSHWRSSGSWSCLWWHLHKSVQSWMPCRLDFHTLKVHQRRSSSFLMHAICWS